MEGEQKAQNNAAHLILVLEQEQVVWTREQVENKLPHFSSREVCRALASLEDEGVLIRVGTLISASRCARHMESLEMLLPWEW